ELARVQVKGTDITADTVLSSRNPDEDLVANDQWSPSDRLAQLRITVLCGPDDFAGLRIQCIDLRIERGHQNFSVGIRDAAVHEVATGYGRRHLVLLRHEFPDDVPIAVEIDSVDVVRIGALKIHHIADDQRLPFMSTESAGGHSPRHMELENILRIDL